MSPSGSAKVQIEGLTELRRKLKDEPVHWAPVRSAFSKAAVTVESRSKKLTPVDTGRLRASLTHRLDASPLPRYAEVGTNVDYAKYVHEGRKVGSKMPPIAALTKWAKRHNIKSVWMLARRIKARGIKPRRFLVQALEESRSEIDSWLRQAAREVEQRWGK